VESQVPLSRGIVGQDRGFTLIELVIVLVLLGIVGTISMRFIADTGRVYEDARERERMASGGRVALERIAREVGSALPNSVRVSSVSYGDCVEFVPVEAAGRSVDSSWSYSGGNTVPLTSAAVSFHVLGDDLADRANDPEYVDDVEYVYVSPTPETVYSPIPAGSSNRARAVSAIEIESAGTTGLFVVRLDGSGAFSVPGSEAHRLFLTGSPVSFCRRADKLYRYASYGRDTTPPTSYSATADAASSLLAERVSAPGTPGAFSIYSDAGLLQIELELGRRGRDQPLQFSREVQIQ